MRGLVGSDAGQVLQELQRNDRVAGLGGRRRFLLHFDLKPVEVCLDVDPLVEILSGPVHGVDAVPPAKKGGTLTGGDDEDILDPPGCSPSSELDICPEKAWEAIGLYRIVPLQMSAQGVSLSR